MYCVALGREQIIDSERPVAELQELDARQVIITFIAIHAVLVVDAQGTIAIEEDIEIRTHAGITRRVDPIFAANGVIAEPARD